MTTAVDPEPARETEADRSDADADHSPGVALPAGGSSIGLGDLLEPVKRSLVVAGVLQAIAAVAAVVPFIAVAEIVRSLLVGTSVDSDQLWRLARVTLAALAVRGALALLASTITHYADNDLQLSLRLRSAHHLRRVPLGWFTARSSGAVKKAIGDDVASMHHIVGHALLDLIAAVVTPLVAIAYLFVLDWRLALVCLVPVVIGVGTYAFMMQVSFRHMAEYARTLTEVNTTAVEFVEGIAVVKTFGQARRSHERFLTVTTAFVDFFWTMVRDMLRLSAANEVVMAPLTALTLILAAGTWFVAMGWTTPALVAAVAVIGVNLTAPILALSHSVESLQQASQAAARIGELLDTPVLPEATTLPPGPDPGAPSGVAVSFDNVSFSYGEPGSADALSDVTLDLPAGSMTALVGRSGSGKSTMAKLVARFWDVDRGTVRVQGDDVRDLTFDELYRRVGFVFQDVRLLSMTIRDNIALARPDATEEQVHAAASAAHVHNRIIELPDGYDTIVGGRDVRLSGGELQRLSIARAILADAPILVLDEATAFADPESEAVIQDALSTLVAGRTVLVIAHRLHTITAVDQIVVVDRGRIVERGRHDDLIAADGTYAGLWRSYESIGRQPPNPNERGRTPDTKISEGAPR